MKKFFLEGFNIVGFETLVCCKDFEYLHVLFSDREYLVPSHQTYRILMRGVIAMGSRGAFFRERGIFSTGRLAYSRLCRRH